MHSNHSVQCVHSVERGFINLHNLPWGGVLLLHILAPALPAFWDCLSCSRENFVKIGITGKGEKGQLYNNSSAKNKKGKLPLPHPLTF